MLVKMRGMETEFKRGAKAKTPGLPAVRAKRHRGRARLHTSTHRYNGHDFDYSDDQATIPDAARGGQQLHQPRQTPTGVEHHQGMAKLEAKGEANKGSRERLEPRELRSKLSSLLAEKDVHMTKELNRDLQQSEGRVF